MTQLIEWSASPRFTHRYNVIFAHLQQLKQNQVKRFVLTRKSCPRIGKAAVEHVPTKNRGRIQALSSVSPITLTPGRWRTPPVVHGHCTVAGPPGVVVAGPPTVVVAGSPAVAFGRRERQTYHAEEVLHDDDSRAFKSPLICLSVLFSSAAVRRICSPSSLRLRQ